MGLYIKEKPHHQILDREMVIKQVSENFKDQIDLLEDLVNYGTNLLIRALPTQNVEFEDSVVLAVLFKHAITLLDSVHILVTNGAVLSAHIPARCLFEIMLYIEWILKADTIVRSKRYLVDYYLQHLREAKYFQNRFTNDIDFANSFKSASKKISIDFDKLEEITSESISNLESVINSDDFRVVTKEFMEQKKKKGRRISWYELDGPSNIFELSKKLNRDIDYFIHYRHLSRIIHGMVQDQHIDIQNSAFLLTPVRNLSSIDKLITSVVHFALTIYAIIVTYYRHDEKNNFAEKYNQKWRERFAIIKEVQYLNSVSYLSKNVV